MVSPDPLVASLTAAVEANPADVVLRLHLAHLLLDRGDVAEAIGHCATALHHDPTSADARRLMRRALAGPDAVPTGHRAPAGDAARYDWRAAESELGDIAAPMFVEPAPDEVIEAAETVSAAETVPAIETVPAVEEPISAWSVERSTLTLADVGGMSAVKDRLEAAFLAPMRNPELRRLYGKSLRGGLLLYGPPGCGKTFLARAVAGELGSRFIPVGLADVLDMYVGQSEKNLHELFELARRQAPVVLFLDEVDALGQKRSQTRHSATRHAVNQLLTELDGVSANNEGVFVLAATNQPWDVDPALRRPGRLDRTLLVLPPDAAAREVIFRHHLALRPVEGVDLGALARATEGFSGADIAHVCETASEKALLDGVRTGNARMIGMADLTAALREVRPSVGGWLETARTVVEYGNADGAYDELAAYLRQRRRR